MASIPPLTTALGSASPLTLGGVQFQTQQAPEDFPIGAIEQRLAIIELAGGGRVVQAMGAQPKPVTWKGRFYANEVATVIPALQGYAVDGRERLLTWGREQWYCIVKDVTPTYKFAFYSLYDITVEITRAANGILTIASPLSVDTQVQALVTSANISAAAILAADATAPNFAPSIANIQLQLNTMGPIAQASTQNITALSGLIGTAQAQAQPYAAGLTSASPSYVQTQQYIAYLALMQTNVTNGQAQTSIRVQGVNLYETAATYFGDVTQAFSLANMNGIFAMQLTRRAPTIVNLPPLPNG
jgi:hypothetical protein